MVDGDLQFDMFRKAKKAGQSAGFDIYCVIVSAEEIQYTWEREVPGRETLRHQVTIPMYLIESARSPLSVADHAFMREAKTMQRFREMNEQH